VALPPEGGGSYADWLRCLVQRATYSNLAKTRAKGKGDEDGRVSKIRHKLLPGYRGGDRNFWS